MAARDEQRYPVHALRKVTAKLPERHHRELKARWWKAFDEAAPPAEARRGLEAIIADHRAAYPGDRPSFAHVDRWIGVLGLDSRMPAIA